MPAPPDLTRMARALLEPNDRELVDRATLLPIGQYEDGSLTFAWPGFLKDAYDGAVRSAVAQEGAPLYDDGGQYVSGAQMQPLDAFNAASIAPVAGVGMRAAGMAPNAGRDMAMSRLFERGRPDSLQQGMDAADLIRAFAPDPKSRWNSVAFPDDQTKAWGPATSDIWQTNANADSFYPMPGVANGLRPVNDASIGIVRFNANPDNASLPSLLGQSQQGTQLASADPQYDAYDLLQQMRRPPPSPFWIDFQALDQQQMMDPPQMTIPPERQSPERLIPLRDKW